MATTELDTFILKFKQLWQSGLNAHLDLESNAGQAWLGLRLQLGDVPGPSHGPTVSHFIKSSPSRDRRNDRRAAEQVAKASTSDLDISDETSDVAEEARDISVEEANKSKSSAVAVESCEENGTDDIEASVEDSQSIKEEIDVAEEAFVTENDVSEMNTVEINKTEVETNDGTKAHDSEIETPPKEEI